MIKPNDHKFAFHGTGANLFGIVIVNLLLTIITLGLYYPWARAAVLQYTYKETEFIGSRFTFHGTGKEMFKGFIKAIGIILAIYGIAMALIFYVHQIAGILFLYLGLLALLPFIIHGGLRYRMSRTSWRGIHFGYRGKFNELSKMCYKDLLLTLLTLGIYSAWLQANIKKYTTKHVRYGNTGFSFTGTGGQLFKIYVVGTILTYITLGIYIFWYMKDLLEYQYNNLYLHQGENIIPVKTSFTGGGLFKVLIGNFFIVLFTFGIGAPWAQVRMLKYLSQNIVVDETFDPNIVKQTEEEYKDATGEDLGDMLDLGFI